MGYKTYRRARNQSASWTIAGIGIAASLLAGGCTRESVRVAIDAQRRADQVQQAVFERQHDGLTLLLFRDLLARMRECGAEWTPEQLATLEAVWNERDLVEFWTVQQERSKALRLAGVDAKLFSDQSAIDLLIKALDAKMDRAKEAVVAQQAAAAQPDAGQPASGADAGQADGGAGAASAQP